MKFRKDAQLDTNQVDDRRTSTTKNKNKTPPTRSGTKAKQEAMKPKKVQPKPKPKPDPRVTARNNAAEKYRRDAPGKAKAAGKSAKNY
jgi:hypothetical protein